ncbi:hypothetical protein P7H16_00640 [Paenibacillus larvae]|nr:hypothetical protein [Paenibacillus larvae]MDT2245811.1 hypothetical protein [Paenibacillus larvae]
MSQELDTYLLEYQKLPSRLYFEYFTHL